MATYVVFIRESTRNPSELEAYAPKAQARTFPSVRD
jgi:hypothetical protein